MANIYSKSFFYDTVAPGAPVSFMTGASTELWIVRDILCVQGTGALTWSVEITDVSGNVVFVTPVLSPNPYISQPLRMVLMPATSYTVSAGGADVFVSLSGYVLSAP
jgi:hypothetical protein